MATEIKAPYIDNLIQTVNNLEDKAIVLNQEGTVISNNLALEGHLILVDSKGLKGRIMFYSTDYGALLRIQNNDHTYLFLSDNTIGKEINLGLYDGYKKTSYQIIHSGNIENYAGRNYTYEATIPAEDNAEWIESDNSFYITISLDAIEQNDNPLIGINPLENATVTDVQELQNEFAKILRIITQNGSIKIIALEKPSKEIPIQLKVMR